MNMIEYFKNYELYIVGGLAVFIVWFSINTYFYYKSEKRKVKHLHRFAKEGEVEAQTNLARRYQKGKMVKQSCNTAAFWYQKAAFSGDKQAKSMLDGFLKKSKNKKRGC
jgi:TPR repeat protein